MAVSLEDHDLIKSHTLHPVLSRLYETPRTIILFIGGEGGEEGGEIGFFFGNFRGHLHETVFAPLGCVCAFYFGGQ